jgi:hypothetical protein
MFGRRAVGLVVVVALSSLLAACGTSPTAAPVSGARGSQVSVVHAAKCGFRTASNQSPGPTLPLPKLIRIDVGCASLTKPSDIGLYVRALRAADAPKCTGELLVWGGLPIVVGTDTHGRHWLLHLPASSCGAPKEPALDLTWELARTGHLPPARTHWSTPAGTPVRSLKPAAAMPS